MDRVRFGRALGFGARAAAKSLLRAADAAAAPDPGKRPETGQSQRPGPSDAGTRAVRSVPQAPARAQAAVQGVRAARQGVLKPVKRFTSVVMLQVSGTFFAVFAVTLGAGAWRMRPLGLRMADAGAAQRFYLAAVLAGLFSYFAVTSFVRARRRGRS